MITTNQNTKNAPKVRQSKSGRCTHDIPVECCLFGCQKMPEYKEYLSRFKSSADDDFDDDLDSDKDEDGLGFHPGFPPRFDPERAEKGLAQEDAVEESSFENALHSALYHFEDAAERWSLFIENGATDRELTAAIEMEFGLGGGSTRHGGYRYKGGKSPEFSWPGYVDRSKAQTFKGKRLLAKVREVLEIGAPGQAGVVDDGLAQAEVDPDKKRLHEEALARWRRERPASADAGESNGYHPQMLRMIPLDQIVPSPTNPRKYFDPDKLQELANSIIEHGLAQPILVRPTTLSPIPGGEYDDESFETQYYETVAGERRWRAAKLAGLTVIEAKVRDLDDKAVLEIQFIENLQRADLSPIEEAEGYKRLLDQHGYTADSLAGKLAKSKSYVYGRLKLCDLPPAAMDALANGDLPATVGELIGRLPSAGMRQEFWEEHYGGLGQKWFEAPSFRDVKQVIEQSYMRELKSAPFSQSDKKLLPGVPSCKDCPKRTGNDRISYPDSRADICTDTDCYDKKVVAINRRKLAEAANADGARVLSPEESQGWFGHSYLVTSAETRDYIDLSEECDAAADPDDWEKPAPTYAELLGDAVKTEVVGLDRGGQVHQLVSRKAAEAVLKEKGIKIASPARTEADRKASQQKHGEEKQIRQEAAAEICERVIQSLTDKPFELTRRQDAVSPFLYAVCLHLAESRDVDVARFVAKRRGLESVDARGSLAKAINGLPAQTALEMIVELLLARELDSWISFGEHAHARYFPICEYFGLKPKAVLKEVSAKQKAEKKSKPKAKAEAAARA